jgi:formamidase
MSSFLNVAVVQITCDLTNGDLELRKAAQKAKIDRYFDTVLNINPTVDLFVLPETAVSGYDLANWDVLGESIPGPTSDYFCQKAREMGKWICPGSIIEKVAGSADTRNTALLISPAGEIVMRISKRFVPYPFEPAVRGNEFPVFSIPGVGKVGIMNCADTAVPEVARNLAFNGAEIIINVLCQGIFIGGLRHRVPVTQVRAMENQCYVVAVNQAAPEGMGHSTICDPEGRVLEELEEAESFAIVSLNLEEVRRVREFGSFGCRVRFLTLTRDWQAQGGALDACYRRGLENAPVFENQSSAAPQDGR